MQAKDAVFCFYCANTVDRKVPIYVLCFTVTGFNTWQKTLEKFRNHQQTHSHHFASDLLAREQRNETSVSSMLRSSSAEQEASILSSVRFLARQGLPLRGHYYTSVDSSQSGEGKMVDAAVVIMKE